VFDTILKRVPWVVAAVMALAVTGPAALAGTDDGIGPSAVANVNADRVDGRHAIKYTSNTTARKSRLMAIGATGYLPNNIIQKAMDADKIDGIDSTALATMAALQSSAGAVNEAGNPVHWNQLQGVPPGIINGTTISVLGETKTIAGGAADGVLISYPASMNVYYELYPVTPGGLIVTEGDLILRSPDSTTIVKGVNFVNLNAVPVTVRVRLTAFNPGYVAPAKPKGMITTKFVDKLAKRFRR
jgi:hypothetical protein